MRSYRLAVRVPLRCVDTSRSYIQVPGQLVVQRMKRLVREKEGTSCLQKFVSLEQVRLGKFTHVTISGELC